MFYYCFEHCFIPVGESEIFSNTVCITVSNCCFTSVWKFWKYCFINYVIFGLLLCILFKYCFITAGMVSKITVFCLREFEPVIDYLQHVLSRVRSGNLSSASLRACEMACNAPPCSTKNTRLLRCSGLLEWTSFNLALPGTVKLWHWQNETEGFFFSARTSICVVALELRRLAARDVLRIAYSWKTFYCLLIPITSRGRPVFRVVSCYDFVCQDRVFCKHFRQKTKELQNYHSQSPSALTRVPTTLAFFNGVWEAWSLCSFLQATGPSPTWNRVGLLRDCFYQR